MNEVNVLKIPGCSFRLFPKEYALLVCTWLPATVLLKEDAKIDMKTEWQIFLQVVLDSWPHSNPDARVFLLQKTIFLKTLA